MSLRLAYVHAYPPRRVERGVTRIVLVVGRWAVKVPRWGNVTRGWLANRSEWRQRRRTDIARPVLTVGHFVVVFPRARLLGHYRDSGPWDGWEDLAEERDERKPDSWGLFSDGWRIIDFDRSWQAEDRGWVGALYYGRQERLARKWAEL